MATLIVSVLFGIVMAYFATQNTQAISLNFWNYSVPGIPIYMVVVGGLLVGLLLSWVISLVNSVITAFTLRGKESTIKDYRKENAELAKQIHQLELENTRIKAETNTPDDDKSL
jgi:uncharacterized integral membrane protein